MLTLTYEEFLEKRADIFDLADSGETIVIDRGKKPSYILKQMDGDDLYFSPEMKRKIKKAEREIEAGQCVAVNGKEELKRFLESL